MISPYANNQAAQGNITEKLVVYRISKYGFPTELWGGQMFADCLMEVNGQYYKVQVKGSKEYTRKSGHSPRHRFQVTHGAKKKYPKGAIDLFALVATDKETIHFIPGDLLPDMKTITIAAAKMTKENEERSLAEAIAHLLR